ncbi:hypothetical protein BLNAU_3578 [Blattamonas nauphoetae]|uniref:Uncharacterized protein n=1 Tax=Blattamonas nauphoetae TaxID=2049346 RepID=A0ABQ9YCH3_9EUKA|nr:hypothetical protein BLNAU_3578 [Blattamonas nauphoetae]
MQSQFVHPQFAVVDLKSIRLMKDKSETYLSLINFIKSKKPFSQRYLEKAFDLLDAVAPGGYFRLDAEEVLLDLVPTPNHDWEGFAETMVILASSKNMDQLSSVLSFLTSIVSSLDAQEHIRLLENGFIPRLVTAVNPQTLPLSGHPNHENFISHLNE